MSQEIYERLLDEVGQVFPGHFRAPGSIGSFTLSICLSTCSGQKSKENSTRITAGVKEQGAAPGKPVRLGFQVVNERLGLIDTEHYLDLDKPDWKLLREALREAREHALAHLASSLQFCGVPLTNKPVLDPPPGRLTFDQLDWKGAAVLCGLPGRSLKEMAERFGAHLDKKGAVALYDAGSNSIPRQPLREAAQQIKSAAQVCKTIVGIYPTGAIPQIFDQGHPAKLAQETSIPVLVVRGAQRFPDLTLPHKTKISASTIYWAESRGGLLTVIQSRRRELAGKTFRVVA